MELARGLTLEEWWISLSVEEKQDVCADLRRMVSDLHSFRVNESEQVIGEFALCARVTCTEHCEAQYVTVLRLTAV